MENIFFFLTAIVTFSCNSVRGCVAGMRATHNTKGPKGCISKKKAAKIVKMLLE